MNRIYSTVWSEARGTYVVAHEKSKAKGKPSTRKGVVEAVAAALLALGAGQAMAVPFAPCPPAVGSLITVNSSVLSTCTLQPGQSLLVTAPGSISVSGGDAVYVGGGTLAGGIDNAGSILTSTSVSGNYANTYANGINVAGGSFSGGITNSNTIGALASSSAITVSGGGYAYANADANAYGISVAGSSFGGGIVNSGTIAATASASASASGISAYANANANAYGINVNGSSFSGGITNSGLITATASAAALASASSSSSANANARAYGINVVNSSFSGGITNSGTIVASASVSGGSANAIGIRVAGSSIGGSITNQSTGYIAGGIRVESNSSVNGGIVNAGRIDGTGYEGIYVNNATVNGITNSLTGTITGNSGIGIINGSITSDIRNSGVIAASYTGLQIAGSGTVSPAISGDIVNSGSASVILGGYSGISIYSGASVTGSIINQGTIAGAFYTGIGVYNGSTIVGGITNSGTIMGGNVGIYLTNGTIAGGIHNLAGGQIIGSSGVAMALWGAGITDVTNAGTINGAVNGIANLTNNGLYILPEQSSNPNTASISSIGSLSGAYVQSSISGNYVQGSTGTLRIGAAGTASGQYSTLSVGGNASLGGTLDVNVNAGNSLAIGNSLAGVIRASGSVSGTFARVTDNSELFDFSAVYSANAVNLNIAAASTTGIFDDVTAAGNTPASNAAQVLDGIISANPTGPIATLFLPLTTQQQVSNAVSQTLPLLPGGQTVAVSGALHGVSRIVQARQEGQQGRSSGDEFLGNKQAWVKPFGSAADQDDKSGVSGYKARTSGIVFGVDSEVQSINRLGGALAITRTNVDGNSAVAPQSATVDSYQLMVYGSRSLSDATDINFQADIGSHANKGSRNITFVSSVAKSDYRSLSLHLGAGVAHTRTLSEQTSFTPSLRADYTRINNDAYTETGAGALNLNVGSNTAEEFIVSADAKLTHKLKENTLLTANLGVGFDTMNQQASITAAYAGAPSAVFTTQGLKPSAWLLRGGLGVVHTTATGLELSARYDVESRESFINQTVSAKLRWAF